MWLLPVYIAHCMLTLEHLIPHFFALFPSWSWALRGKLAMAVLVKLTAGVTCNMQYNDITAKLL